MQRKQKIIVTSGLVLLLVLCALGMLTRELWKKQSASSRAALYAEAMEFYNKGDFEQGADLISGQYRDLLEEEGEGCELSISLFATARRYDKVRDAAERCIRLGKAEGLAHEAYAHASLELGKAQEGITWLQAHPAKLDAEQRSTAALARLYLEEKDWANARASFLTAIEHSDIWSLWLSLVIRAPEELVRDQAFMQRLAFLVRAKPRHFGKTEESLADLAAQAGVPASEVDALRAHAKIEDPIP